MGVLSLTFSSSAYASSIAQIRDEFQISQEVALLGIALFVLGFSLSPIVFGPLVFSIGHRWTYILSYGCFTAFAFGAAEARNGASLVILRFWSGFFGGSTFNNALATVADVSVEKVRSIFRIHDWCWTFHLPCSALPYLQFTYPQQINRFSVFFALAAFGGREYASMTPCDSSPHLDFLFWVSLLFKLIHIPTHFTPLVSQLA